MANFVALAAARHALLQREGWDVEKQGLFGAPPIAVVVSDEVHVSVLKALSLLGLGRDRVQRAPTDTQGRMRPEFIPETKGPTIICAQVGHVATGTCDLIAEIRARAQEPKPGCILMEHLAYGRRWHQDALTWFMGCRKPTPGQPMPTSG